MELLWEVLACPLFVNGGRVGSIDRGLGNS
jgi:hypothetical protein